MAANIRHESRAVIVRRGHVVDEIMIWENAACKGLDFQDLLPKLLNRPSWDAAPERAQMDSEVTNLQRLAIPPTVHFSRSSDLLVTSVHAAVIHGSNLQRGSWTRPEQFIAQASEQWQSTILSLLCQLRFAMTSGYLSLPSDNQISSRTEQRSTPPVSHALLTSLTRRPANENAAAAEPSSSYFGPIITCSGYPDQGIQNEDQVVAEAETTVSNPRELEEERAGAMFKQQVSWVPGQVVQINEGGSAVQAVLESEGLRLGIISWHAPWVESCLELVPFMQRLAARFPSIAVMHLDVEASTSNKLLAYEKVLVRAESRRIGAKPVVRDGQKFPCLTTHDPFNLIPTETFCGLDSLDELAKLLASRGPELTQQPPTRMLLSTVQPLASSPVPAAVPAPAEHPWLPPEPHAAAQPGRAQQPATETDPTGLTQNQAGELLTGLIKLAAATDAPESGSQSSDEDLPKNFHVLQNGALEFKQILSQEKDVSRLVVVLWRGGGTPLPMDLPRVASSRLDAVFVDAPVTPGTDSAILADRLGVKTFPCAQGYYKMKLVKTFDRRSLQLGDLATAELFNAMGHLDSSTRSTDGSGHPTSSSRTASEYSEAAKRISPPAPRGDSLPQTGHATSTTADRQQERDETFDPPRTGSKPGAKKRLPGGVGVYWPRMPCLWCGCPWWFGEDWDARCARCDWTAEKDGYDDDSKPLPKYEAKYAEFTAALQGGRTAAYKS